MTKHQKPPVPDPMPAMASVVGQVGCLVVFLIGLSLGAGMLLDEWLGTNSIFTVIFILGSVPVSLYLTIRVSMRTLTRMQTRADEAAKKVEDIDS